MIRLENIGKCYSLRTDKAFLLRDCLLGLVGKRPRMHEFWALRGVSLHVRKGDALAVIGRNGAGKSTLLGVIAKTIYPTEGRVTTEGRVCALLELGAGFHPDLTGRENIHLNASLLGLGEDEVEAKFKDIVDFAELWQFIDLPIGKYSSGMSMRLGFSVAVHIEPEILIIDEVLAVGDQRFQHKCLERLQLLKARGTTFLLVSHSPDSIRFLCQRAVWIDHGTVQAEGAVEDVLARYAAAPA